MNTSANPATAANKLTKKHLKLHGNSMIKNESLNDCPSLPASSEGKI
jgi:hypothetical protein